MQGGQDLVAVDAGGRAHATTTAPTSGESETSGSGRTQGNIKWLGEANLLCRPQSERSDMLGSPNLPWCNVSVGSADIRKQQHQHQHKHEDQDQDQQEQEHRLFGAEEDPDVPQRNPLRRATSTAPIFASFREWRTLFETIRAPSAQFRPKFKNTHSSVASLGVSHKSWNPEHPSDPQSTPHGVNHPVWGSSGKCRCLASCAAIEAMTAPANANQNPWSNLSWLHPLKFPVKRTVE